jgi:hypothetical protein
MKDCRYERKMVPAKGIYRRMYREEKITVSVNLSKGSTGKATKGKVLCTKTWKEKFYNIS